MSATPNRRRSHSMQLRSSTSSTKNVDHHGRDYTHLATPAPRRLATSDGFQLPSSGPSSAGQTDTSVDSDSSESCYAPSTPSPKNRRRSVLSEDSIMTTPEGENEDQDKRPPFTLTTCGGDVLSDSNSSLQAENLPSSSSFSSAATTLDEKPEALKNDSPFQQEEQRSRRGGGKESITVVAEDNKEEDNKNNKKTYVPPPSPPQEGPTTKSPGSVMKETPGLARFGLTESHSSPPLLASPENSPSPPFGRHAAAPTLKNPTHQQEEQRGTRDGLGSGERKETVADDKGKNRNKSSSPTVGAPDLITTSSSWSSSPDDGTATSTTFAPAAGANTPTAGSLTTTAAVDPSQMMSTPPPVAAQTAAAMRMHETTSPDVAGEMMYNAMHHSTNKRKALEKELQETRTRLEAQLQKMKLEKLESETRLNKTNEELLALRNDLQKKLEEQRTKLEEQTNKKLLALRNELQKKFEEQMNQKFEEQMNKIEEQEQTNQKLEEQRNKFEEQTNEKLLALHDELHQKLEKQRNKLETVTERHSTQTLALEEYFNQLGNCLAFRRLLCESVGRTFHGDGDGADEVAGHQQKENGGGGENSPPDE